MNSGTAMMEQPDFGRRLKELRRARRLSQATLAGEEISTGYLSRLESGARHPTERVVTYLVGRLAVERSAFDVPPRSGSLAQALSLATSSDSDETVEGLIAALDRAEDAEPLPRWQALWIVSRYRQRRGEHAEERAALEELVRIADELALPELRCRARSRLARSLRGTGEVTRAIDVAAHAYRLATRGELSVPDVGTALQTLVAAEAEAGRLPDARAHVDELVALVEHAGSEVMRTEALWSAATVRFRQGEHERAREFLERAVRGLDSRVDLTLWVRLRLATASLCLQTEPPLTGDGRVYLREAEGALALVGTSVMRQELLMLRAYLAFHEGRYEDARAAHDELDGDDVRMTYRDRIRLSVLDSRLLLLEGHEERGLARLRELGEEARQAANVDLAADIWRILAGALEATRRIS
ncbi:helix-turn-helix domain-containing protein [Streptomyces liangshanensis]|uniref:helix-turn-helix domain-containing protein n=1 Tax=Streptomyces liangshanensis TaxID=2717324 RepID=UPI0036D83221